jgi:serine/threonine protein kinase
MNEKNIMVKINHPFLAKLHHSFETANYFMLIMDYYPGG